MKPLRIETKELGNCLRILGYEEHHDKKVIKELLSSDIPWTLRYCKPFKNELKKNLLQVKNTKGKIGIVNYYISELYGISDFLKSNYEMLFIDDPNHEAAGLEFTNQAGERKPLNEFGKYIVICRLLYSICFEYIEDVCKIYSLNFLEQCTILNVDLTHYEVSLDKKREILPNKGKPFSNKNQYTLPTAFKDIFALDDWKPYVDVLTELEKPILLKNGDNKWKLGYRTIGALCNYFGDLLHESILKGTRQEICNVLYKEVGLKVKPDISSLTKMNNAYHRNNGYKAKLKRNKILFPKGDFGKL